MSEDIFSDTADMFQQMFVFCQYAETARMPENYKIWNPYASSKKTTCSETTTLGQHSLVLTTHKIMQVATSSSKIHVRNPYITPKHMTHPMASPCLSYIAGGATAVSTEKTHLILYESCYICN